MWVVVDVIVVDAWIDYYDGLVVGIVGDELWVVMGCEWERGLRSFVRLALSLKQRARLVERAPQLDFWMAREIHAVVRDRALPRSMELTVTLCGGSEIVGTHWVTSHAVRRELRRRARVERRERLVRCQIEYADGLGAQSRVLPTQWSSLVSAIGASERSRERG